MSVNMSKYTKMLKCIKVLDTIDILDSIDDLDNDYYLNMKFDDEEDDKIPSKPLRDMTNPIEIFSKEEFKLRYTLSKETVLYILKLIVHGLERSSNRGKPVPPMIELLIAIRFMTSGTLQSMIDDLHGVSQPTISRLIYKVSSLLAELRHMFITFPSDKEKRMITKQFYDEFKFPNIVGCLGATHVGIKNPGGQISEAYLNEHGYYSIKVQVVSGPNLEFLDLLPRWPGSTHESKIYNISDIKSNLALDSNYYLLANSSYPQLQSLLTPLKSPTSKSELKYNNLHHLAYNIPQVLELWKKRFKCLTTILGNKEDTTRSIIQATAVLHNIALKHKDDLPETYLSETIQEPKKGKDVKRTYPLDKPLISELNAVESRKKIINEYFN